MFREDIRRFALLYMNNKYCDYIQNYYENPTLFEIIEYGHQEIVHSKFLYWMLRPAFHRFSYKDKYVKMFLQKNDINVNDESNITVYCEQVSDLLINEDESKRRADLFIDIENGEKRRRVVIENKLYSDITEFQIDHEVRQYLYNKNDVFIAFLLDLHKQSYFELINRSKPIDNHKDKGIIFKLFTYSDWLNLNRELYDQKKFFSRNEKQKIKHLNENIRRLVAMCKLKDFNENFKIYMENYRAIQHFEEEFQEQSHIFLQHLMNRINEETPLSNGRMKQRKRGLKFDFGRYDIEIEIDFSPENGLNENIGNILIGIPRDNEHREDLINKIQGIDGFDPQTGNAYWKWIELTVNPFNIKECEDQYMNKLKEIIQSL